MVAIIATNSTCVLKNSTFNDVDQENHVSLRAAVTAQSTAGGQGFVKCNCSGVRKCQANRCKCY